MAITAHECDRHERGLRKKFSAKLGQFRPFPVAGPAGFRRTAKVVELGLPILPSIMLYIRRRARQGASVTGLSKCYSLAPRPAAVALREQTIYTPFCFRRWLERLMSGLPFPTPGNPGFRKTGASLSTRGVDGARWPLRSSKPLCLVRSGVGGFDSLALPPGSFSLHRGASACQRRAQWSRSQWTPPGTYSPPLRSPRLPAERPQLRRPAFPLSGC